LGRIFGSIGIIAMRRWLAPLTIAALSQSLTAQTTVQAAGLKTYSDPHIGFEIALPQNCRHDARPGTIEAVCAPGFDSAKAASLAAAQGWLFEIDYEVVPSDAAPYSLDALRAEAPDMICGPSDAADVLITSARETPTAAGTSYSADVACPAVGFLSLPERTASVRVVVAGSKRFRLLARTPAADAPAASDMTQTFLASFKLTAQ
jgi:hypothetical protein